MTEEFFTTEDGVRRPSTEAEIQNVLAAREKAAKREADKIAKEAARQAVYLKLGLTSEDVEALFK